MKSNRRIIVPLLVALLFLISTPFLIFAADYSKIKSGEEPIFCSQSAALLDGGTVICQYKGYQIIKWNEIDGRKDLEVKIYPKYSNLIILN